MKTKQIPAIIMLLAGFITCMYSIIQRATLAEFVTRMWIVLILFYILGVVVKVVLDKNIVEKAKKDDLEENQEIEETVDESEEKQERVNDAQQEG